MNGLGVFNAVSSVYSKYLRKKSLEIKLHETKQENEGI
jgi:hypothetical protein